MGTKTAESPGYPDFKAALYFFLDKPFHRYAASPCFLQIVSSGLASGDPGGKAKFVGARRQEISLDHVTFPDGEVAFVIEQFLPVEIAFALPTQIKEDPFSGNLNDPCLHFLPGVELHRLHQAAFQQLGKALLFAHLIQFFIIFIHSGLLPLPRVESSVDTFFNRNTSICSASSPRAISRLRNQSAVNNNGSGASLLFISRTFAIIFTLRSGIARDRRSTLPCSRR